LSLFENALVEFQPTELSIEIRGGLQGHEKLCQKTGFRARRGMRNSISVLSLLGSKAGDKMASGKTDYRLVRGFVPLDGGMGFCAKVFTDKERVEDSNSIEIKPILVFAEVLEKLGEFFGGGETP
jgi:hypothetical protein